MCLGCALPYVGQVKADPVAWGSSSTLGVLDATAIQTTTAPGGVFFSMASSDFGVKVITSGLTQDGLGAGDGSVVGPTWWFEGGTRPNSNQSINYSSVSFQFTSTTNSTSATAVTGVHFVLEDAEVNEQFRNFTYFDSTGASVSIPYTSSIFTFSSGNPGVHLSDGSFDSGSSYAGGTQPGKTIDVNFGNIPITGFAFQTGRNSSSYGSVEMSGLGNITPFKYTDASQSITVTSGSLYDGLGAIATTGHGTVAQLLGGTASEDKSVTMTFTSAGSTPFQTSVPTGDVLNLSGNNGDKFVLQLTYDPSNFPVGTSESTLYLSWFNPMTMALDFANAGNTDLPGEANDLANPEIQGAYDPATDFHLGYYGVDTVNHTVWAVIDHNSDFTVLPAPEPTSTILAVSGIIPLLMRRRRTPAST